MERQETCEIPCRSSGGVPDRAARLIKAQARTRIPAAPGPERVNDFETAFWYLGLASALDRWVDPDGGWLVGRFWWLSDEAFGVVLEGAVERYLAGCMDFIGLSIMNLIRRHQAKADMVVRLIIPHEEHAAECLASSMQPKRAGKFGWYFKVLK